MCNFLFFDLKIVFQVIFNLLLLWNSQRSQRLALLYCICCPFCMQSMGKFQLTGKLYETCTFIKEASVWKWAEFKFYKANDPWLFLLQKSVSALLLWICVVNFNHFWKTDGLGVASTCLHIFRKYESYKHHCMVLDVHSLSFLGKTLRK